MIELKAASVNQLVQRIKEFRGRATRVLGNLEAGNSMPGLPPDQEERAKKTAERDIDILNDVLVLLDIQQSLVGLIDLAARGHVEFRIEQGAAVAVAPCSDVFGVSPECYVVNPKDGAVFKMAFDMYGVCGIYALIGSMMRMDPVEEFRTPEYLKARERCDRIRDEEKDAHS